jgi:hypothetical protein
MSLDWIPRENEPKNHFLWENEHFGGEGEAHFTIY